MSEVFRPCALIPTYDNPTTVRAVVERVRGFLPDVVVVDDGSAAEGAAAVAAVGAAGLEGEATPFRAWNSHFVGDEALHDPRIRSQYSGPTDGFLSAPLRARKETP